MKVLNYFFRKPVRQNSNEYRSSSQSRETRENRESPTSKEKINQKDIIEVEFEEIKSDKK